MYLEAAQIFSAADACRGDIAGIGNEPTHQEFIASQGSAIYGPICDKLSMRNELYIRFGGYRANLRLEAQRQADLSYLWLIVFFGPPPLSLSV